MFDNPKKELERLQQQLLAAEMDTPEEEVTEDFDDLYDEIYDEFGPEEFDEPDLNFYSRAAGFDAELEEYEMDEDRYVAPPRKRGFRGLVVFALVQAFVVIALAFWWLGRLL